MLLRPWMVPGAFNLNTTKSASFWFFLSTWDMQQLQEWRSAIPADARQLGFTINICGSEWFSHLRRRASSNGTMGAEAGEPSRRRSKLSRRVPSLFTLRLIARRPSRQTTAPELAAFKIVATVNPRSHCRFNPVTAVIRLRFLRGLEPTVIIAGPNPRYTVRGVRVCGTSRYGTLIVCY